MLDRKKLALIHIIKRDLGLSDTEYRDTLEKVTGVRSARELDVQGFGKLLRYFARSRHYIVQPGGLTYRQKMFIESLRHDLGWQREHLQNFLKKYFHKSAVQTLTKKEASKVIESLKNVRKHRHFSGFKKS